MRTGEGVVRPSAGYAPLVEVWRGGTVESVHHGAVVVADSAGGLRAAVGDPGTVTFLRSAAKPVQAMALIESGAAERFALDDAEIAVISGSHGGEPFHVEAVRSILKKIGLDESALQCGVHPPMHAPIAEALRAAGAAPTALQNNCSGKHAGMLAQAVHLKAPIETYLDPSHPVQTRIRATIERLAGAAPGDAAMAIDGCSAPTLPLSLLQAAILYARLSDPGPAAPAAARRVARAMRGHPEMVAGTDRLCTVLMRETGRGLIAKIGAEGFYGFGFEADGRGIGIALKIADGDERRARNCAALAALAGLGLIDAQTAARLAGRFVGEVRTHRKLAVGRVAPAFTLEAGPRRRDPGR